MTSVHLHRKGNGQLVGFYVSGHAEYGEYGTDVVCAGISALTIATCNGLEAQKIPVAFLSADEGCIELRLSDEMNEEAAIRADAILETYALGIEGLAQEYGEPYIQVYHQTL